MSSTTFKWSFIIGLIGFILPFTGKGQSLLNSNKVDKQLLEHHIKSLVDSVRVAHELLPLSNDKILYQAADFHAKYLQPKKDIGHYETDAKMKTPQDRVNHFGGTEYLAGENVLRYGLKGSYEATAREMVEGWVNSPGHYANIIEPRYVATGLAVRKHPKTGFYIAVQVFATIPYQYEFKEDAELFPYSKTPLISLAKPLFINNSVYKNGHEKIVHHLKKYDRERSHRCKKCVMIPDSDIRPEIRGALVYFKSKQAKYIKQIFKSRRDGIVAEYVNFEPYHCDNPNYGTYPSRRNDNSSTNGYLTKPVYRHQILKDLRRQKREFRKERHGKIKLLRKQKKFSEEAQEQFDDWKEEKFDPHFTEALIDTFPILGVDYISVNFLVIHNRKIHYPLHFTGYCGNPGLEHQEKYVLDVFELSSEIKAQEEHHQFSFKNYYARGETEINDSIFQNIEDSLKGWNIEYIQIKSFSSVEGSDSLNQKYHTLRAKAVVDGLNEYYDRKPSLSVDAAENWEMFYQQLKSARTKSLRKMNKAEIKKKLTNEKYINYWNPLLDQQRYSEITIFVDRISKLDTLDFVLNDLAKAGMYNLNDFSNNKQEKVKNGITSNGALSKKDKSKTRGKKGTESSETDKQKSKLLKEKNKVYHQYLKLKHPNEFLKIRYPGTSQYEVLAYDQLNYKLSHLDTNKVKEITELVEAFKRHDRVYKSNIAFLNREILKVNYLHKKGIKGRYNPKVLKRISDLCYSGAYTKKAQSLKCMYYLTYIPHMDFNRNYDEVNDGFDYLLSYYLKHPELYDETVEVIDIVDFFLFYELEESAMQILNRYLQKGRFNKYLYTQFLKIAFIHPTHKKNRDFIELLLDARANLTDQEWCDLFVGSCNVDFQIFDDPELRSMYCETCGSGHYKKQFEKD